MYRLRTFAMGAVISMSLYYIFGFAGRALFPRGSVTKAYSALVSPPPPVLHQTLTADVIGDRQVFVIGDVHGCYDELVLILEKAGVTKDTVVIFVGDMTNKGPKSIQVLELIKEIGAYAVRGNHESKVLRNLDSIRKDPDFVLSKSVEWIRQLSVEQREYLSSLPYSISVPSLNSIFVHAGLVPGLPLEQQNPGDINNMRNVIITNTDNGQVMKATGSNTEGEPWAKHWNGPQHVYFGHDAVRKLQLYAYCTGLDTGCIYGGQLTGMYVTGTKQRFSVPALHVYKKPDVAI